MVEANGEGVGWDEKRPWDYERHRFEWLVGEDTLSYEVCLYRSNAEAARGALLRDGYHGVVARLATGGELGLPILLIAHQVSHYRGFSYSEAKLVAERFEHRVDHVAERGKLIHLALTLPAVAIRVLLGTGRDEAWAAKVAASCGREG